MLIWATSPTPQWWVFPLRQWAQLKSQTSAPLVKFCHSTQLLGWSLGKRWAQQVASQGGRVVTKKLYVPPSSLLLFKNISGIFVINVVWEELVSLGLSDISKQLNCPSCLLLIFFKNMYNLINIVTHPINKVVPYILFSFCNGGLHHI